MDALIVSFVANEKRPVTPPLHTRPRRPYLRGPAALTYAAPPPLRRGPASLTSRPRRLTYAAPPPLHRGPAALTSRPRRLTYAAPSPLPTRPRRPYVAAPPPSRRGPAALTYAAPPPSPPRPRRPHLRGTAALTFAASRPSPSRPRRSHLRGPAALTFAASPPVPTRPRSLLLRGPAALTSRPRRPHLRGRAGLPSCRAARAAARHAARYRSSRAAQQQPPSRRAAEPQYRRAAPQPSRTTAEPPDLPCLGRAIDFEVWVDDLQLFLQCDRADGLSLFDLTSGASPAPAADADPTVRSQWATRDAAARLAVRRHLPTTERAHFSQYKSAQTLYDAVVARYSSPATAALSRLMLPYLFPDLAAFPTVADLITHLRTSDTRYRAALPAEFCARNPPPPCTSLSIT
ncbi:unnamed protein product [Closterium sp. NIES-64]|nr:unnamed protein product [Closterium sp. NIES-64]